MSHWTSRIVDDKWLFIACPIMEEGKMDFKLTLQAFRELKGFEKQVKKDPDLIGLCCKTWVGNMHIMKLLYRMGWTTYKEQHNIYWFQKQLKD
jgi:hypothetical protein